MRIRGKLSNRTALVVLLLAVTATTLAGRRLASRLRVAAQYVVPVLGDTGMYVATSFKSHVREITARGVTPAEAKRLHEERDEWRRRALAYEQQIARYIEHQKARRQLYGRVFDVPVELIPARVVAADALPYGSTRLVTGGTSRGAAPRQRVTTRRLHTDRGKALPEGLAALSGTVLVGRLMETGAFTARLQLVTDRGFQMRARVVRVIDPETPRRITTGGRVRALSRENNRPLEVLAVGDGAGGVLVEGVRVEENVLPGDWLVTRDDDALLPAQVAIGKVTRVEELPGGPHTVRLHVAPQASLDALREVYVVVPLGSRKAGD